MSPRAGRSTSSSVRSEESTKISRSPFLGIASAGSLRDSGFELFIPDGDLTDPGPVWPFAQAPAALDAHQQTWVRDPATLCWRLDIFREPSDGEVWICRLDERIRLPYVEVIEWTDEGIPYGRPGSSLFWRQTRGQAEG